MTVSEALVSLHRNLKQIGINTSLDDEDLIIYAINFLSANAEDAFPFEDEDEDNLDDDEEVI